MSRLFAETFEKRMGSDAFILEQVLRVRLGRFLDMEEARGCSSVVSLEETFQGALCLPSGNFTFACRVDRIDREAGGGLLILDYKTGAADGRPAGADTLARMELTREGVRRAVRSFQLPLYCRFVGERHAGVAARAALYDLRKPALVGFPRPRDDGRHEELMGRCSDALGYIVGEIADPNSPFVPDESGGCAWCPYISLCR
jgi:hypothetical protein